MFNLVEKYPVRYDDRATIFVEPTRARATGEVCTDPMLPTRRLRSGQAWRAACQRANQQALRRPLLAHALELLVDRDQAGAPDAEVDEARTKARVEGEQPVVAQEAPSFGVSESETRSSVSVRGVP